LKPSLLVVAGETSGDMHAARIIEALRARVPDLEVWGIGGDRMAEAGVSLREHVRDMDVLGFSDVLRQYPFFRRVFRSLVNEAQTRRPTAVLLVDYPGFNLRFAREAHRAGLKVIYYVCPQVWAWNRGRVDRMARIIDRLLVIFPFECEVFAGKPLRVDFVGHPLVDEAARILQAPPESLPWNGTPRLALLPGSRRKEIERILPVMIETAERLAAGHPGLSTLVAAPSEGVADVVRAALSRLPARHVALDIVVGRTRNVLRQADAALVASGTATMEAALMRCPMLVVYRTARLTYLLGRMLIRVPYLGMVNIVAGEPLCPEFIQQDAKADRMAAAVAPLLADTPERQRMVQGLERVVDLLGAGGSAVRAAEIIGEELGWPVDKK